MVPLSHLRCFDLWGFDESQCRELILQYRY